MPAATAGFNRDTAPPALPASICGAVDLAPLANGGGFRGTLPDGRRVALKPVPDDCLLAGRLHPNVRQRLARIREIAQTNVGSLCGVERDAATGRVWMVWQWLAGCPIDAWAREASDEAAVRAALREAIAIVQAMHVRGLVHGAVRPGNVIVDDVGRVCLTHASPLLFHDPAVDAAATLDLVQNLVAARGTDGDAWAAAIEGARPAGDPLAAAFAVLALPTPPETSSDRDATATHRSDRRARAALRWAAIAIALAGAAAAAVIAHAVGTGS